ncbi:hypothetical protein K1T71_012344 [Dendrolimus kikuchii]|uniref:Uncharacterized protein n=1 Tax=Dendrolimus kikuchii TaxID=765133 RepID=A0ACC1CLP6_9NEOP|nr:hypothetical protein K1T71_012344 [Dendrolimus kikuchii]
MIIYTAIQIGKAFCKDVPSRKSIVINHFTALKQGEEFSLTKSTCSTTAAVYTLHQKRQGGHPSPQKRVKDDLPLSVRPDRFCNDPRVRSGLLPSI